MAPSELVASSCTSGPCRSGRGRSSPSGRPGRGSSSGSRSRGGPCSWGSSGPPVYLRLLPQTIACWGVVVRGALPCPLSTFLLSRLVKARSRGTSPRKGTWAGLTSVIEFYSLLLIRQWLSMTYRLGTRGLTLLFSRTSLSRLAGGVTSWVVVLLLSSRSRTELIPFLSRG